MKSLSFATVVETAVKLIHDVSYILPDDVLTRLEWCRNNESSTIARDILGQICENARIASESRLPLCQDTGIAVFFVDVGESVSVDGAGLEAALTEATRRGYREGFLRMSMVGDPFRRKNTGDNTPPVIHTRIVPGEELKIGFCPKGGGCENMSGLAMLSPGDGYDGAVGFVVDTIRKAGGRPCPPVVVGVGVGGSFEQSAIIAKRSLLRKIGSRNTDPFYAAMEGELLRRINGLGIGPMGLGGDTTALDVFVEAAPCHIASLPVAVNVQCHSARHGTVVIR